MIDQIRGIAANPSVIAEVLRQMDEQTSSRREALEREKRVMERELGRLTEEIPNLLRAGGQHLTDRMAELQERIEVLKDQLRAVHEQLAERADQSADPAGVAQTLREFDGLWEQMKPREQEKFVKTLVEQVSYDGRTGMVTVGFRTGGIQQMCLDVREGKWSRN